MILCSAVMFGYYHLVLKDKTFHHYNRFYLLSIVVVSLVLPLVKISYFTLEVNNDIYLLLNKIQNSNSTKTLNNDFFYFRLAVLALGLVSVVLLGKLIFGLIRISRFKKEFPKEKIEGISFYQTNLESAPFSFFRNLFWKNSILLNSDLGRQILKHEMVHIEQKHTIDKIVMEVFTGLLWFNPIFWFIKKEIHLIHEYLADKKAVKHMDTKAFAQMLLASHFSGKVIPATSPFLSSNLKKRLKMLQKPKTKFGYVHRILALPIVFTLAFIYMVNAKNKEIGKINESIEKQVSKAKSDTVKTKATAQLVQVAAGQPGPNYYDAQKASEKALFIIGANEVTKQKYLKFLEDNVGNKHLFTSYYDTSNAESKYQLFGSREKFGVYRAQILSEKYSPKYKDDYQKLIKKYNPNWEKNDALKKRVDSEYKMNSEAFKILNENNPDVDVVASSSTVTLTSDTKQKKTGELIITEPKKKAVEKTVLDARELAKNIQKIAKKEDETAEIEANIAQRENAKAKEAAELAKQRAKLAAERAELARQHMELLKKEAELKKKSGTEIQYKTWINGLGTQTPAKGITYQKTVKFTPKEDVKVMSSGTIDKVVINTPDGKSKTYDLKMVDGTRNYKIYIDDKEVSKEEMSALSPKHIKSVSVYKRSVDSKRTHDEIRINTKD